MCTGLYRGWVVKSKVELRVLILKSNAKFEEKMNCGFKNDMKNLVDSRTQNSENLLFERLFSSKECNVSTKKL